RQSFFTPVAVAMAGLALLNTVAQARSLVEQDERLTARNATELPTDRVIVRYRSDGSGSFATVQGASAARVAGNRHGVALSQLRQTASGARVFQLSRALPHADVAALAAALRDGDPNIAYAEPDRVLQPMALTNDPMLSQQWHLNDATGGGRASAAGDRSTGAGVGVAV
ncbi:MAG: peptidase S8, partial [Burkholderiales bacterium PBB5]